MAYRPKNADRVNAVEFFELRFCLIEADLPIEDAVKEFLDGCEAEINNLIESEADGWENGWGDVDGWNDLEEAAAAYWIRNNGGGDVGLSKLEALLGVNFSSVAEQCISETEDLDDAINDGLGQVNGSIKTTFEKYTDIYWRSEVTELINAIRERAHSAILKAIFEQHYTQAEVKVEANAIDDETSWFLFTFPGGEQMTASEIVDEDGDLVLGDMDWYGDEANLGFLYPCERSEFAEAAARMAWREYEAKATFTA